MFGEIGKMKSINMYTLPIILFDFYACSNFLL